LREHSTHAFLGSGVQLSESLLSVDAGLGAIWMYSKCSS